MSLRQQAMAYAIAWINKMDPTGNCAKIIETELGELTDKQFDELMDMYLSEEEQLPIVAPVYGPVNIRVKRNINILKELGADPFQQIVYHSADPDTPSFVAPPKILVLPMPWRRTAQLLVEGISVSKHNNSIDSQQERPHRRLPRSHRDTD